MLGHDKASLQLVDEALTLLPVEKDPSNGAQGLGYAAQTYALLGKADLAFNMLARLRKMPGTDLQTSAATLRLDPVWDKIRSDPRFQNEIDLFAQRQKELNR